MPFGQRCRHASISFKIYDADEVFMDTLAGFASGGLGLGHAAVAIATPAHRRELDRRLTAMGLDVAAARSQDQFISLDAEKRSQSSWSAGGRIVDHQVTLSALCKLHDL
jgi:hypothetical protein